MLAESKDEGADDVHAAADAGRSKEGGGGNGTASDDGGDDADDDDDDDGRKRFICMEVVDVGGDDGNAKNVGD
jgi:hypothetical protein